jgi:hypothetical protein
MEYEEDQLDGVKEQHIEYRIAEPGREPLIIKETACPR